MQRYAPYPDYKPSKVDWLGDVPTHWKIDRAKWSIASCQNGVWGGDPEGNDDLVCIRVADFDRPGFCISTQKLTIRNIPQKDRRNRELAFGDLLLEKSGGGEQQLVGAVVQFNHKFTAVSSNFIARMEPARNHDARFFVYVHSHLYSGRVNYRSIKQTTGIQNLDSQAYLDEHIAYPSLKEQQAIARFLDHKTAQIDALIARKQALLEKLAEKRSALISHAVTKGLDPSVPMKDSAVAWLGGIPAHWQRLVLTRVICRFEQGWSPACEEREAAIDEWGVLKSGCVNYGVFDESEHKTLPSSVSPVEALEVKAGNVLMCRASGSKHLIGSVAKVHSCRPKLIFSDKTYRITLNERLIDPDFFVLAMKSKYMRDQIELSISGAEGLANNIPQASVRSYQIMLPGIAEQQAIIKSLGAEIDRIGQQERKGFAVIAKLQEYRSALITSAVTGKIDVRGFRLPEAAEETAHA